MKQINFNKQINRLRIDVGTAATAPNTAFWLSKYKYIGILGFEPSPENFQILKKGLKTNQYLDQKRLILNTQTIKFKNKVIKKFDNNSVYFFNIGIDYVNKPKKKKFYSVEKKNFGCSSFKKPLEDKLKLKINKVHAIEVRNLKSFLLKLDKKRFPYIDFLKTDTQGNDLNVLKSCGREINRICFIQTEYWANQEYLGDLPRKEALDKTIEYMKKRNFYCYYYTDVDAFFYNRSLKQYISENKILDDCIDFKSGLYNHSKWFFGFDGKLIFLVNIKFFIRRYKIIYNFFKYKLKFKVLNLI